MWVEAWMRRNDLPPGQDGWQVYTYLLALETVCYAFYNCVYRACVQGTKGNTQEVVRAL